MSKEPLSNRSQCATCPAKKGQPCPSALERIHAMQAEMNTSKSANLAMTQGCEWYVNSAEHNYSFWTLANDLQGSPYSDKEICQLLLITQSQLREIFNSAIKKIVARKDEPEIQEWAETVLELANNRGGDGSDYVPDSFKDKMYETGLVNEPMPSKEDDEYGEKPRKYVKKQIDGLGMPIHRSGKKVDLWGLSTNKSKKNDNRK